MKFFANRKVNMTLISKGVNSGPVYIFAFARICFATWNEEKNSEYSFLTETTSSLNIYFSELSKMAWSPWTSVPIGFAPVSFASKINYW